jgi:hypothetical protein
LGSFGKKNPPFLALGFEVAGNEQAVAVVEGGWKDENDGGSTNRLVENYKFVRKRRKCI